MASQEKTEKGVSRFAEDKSLKEQIIEAGEDAVRELIKVAKEKIIIADKEAPDLAADRLKNAAMAKKLAIFDAFEILSRVEAERENIEYLKEHGTVLGSTGGFAEGRAR